MFAAATSVKLGFFEQQSLHLDLPAAEMSNDDDWRRSGQKLAKALPNSSSEVKSAQFSKRELSDEVFLLFFSCSRHLFARTLAHELRNFSK